MLKSILEKDEEILWQSKVSFKPKLILFLFSLVVLIIGSISNWLIFKFIFNTHEHVSDLLLIVFVLYFLFTLPLPITGIIYILFWRFVLIVPTMSYFATNKRIIDKRDKKEYNEYISFEYSEIKKVEIRPSILFRDRIASIRIHPKFNPTNPSEWRFRILKMTRKKIPISYCMAKYHELQHVSDYKPLLKILKNFRVKLTNK